MNTTTGTTTCLVLAAGASRRLGRPKQLLPFPGGPTLLDATLSAARTCGFDQLVLALGADAAEVRRRVDLTGADVVVNMAAAGAGCSSSIAAALPAVRPDCSLIVLLLGDQPGISPQVVDDLVREMYGSGAPMGVCSYRNGVGHPFAFAPTVFDQLAGLHGDKAVWRLREQLGEDVVEIGAPGPVPLDVDTEEDYRALLASLSEPAGERPGGRPARRRDAGRRPQSG